MKLYPLFLLIAAATVLSPGPGVVMTLSNSLRYGLRGSFGGILGIAFGALVVAAISATSLGVVLATSALAFTVLKFIGATYLVYLGLRAWRSPTFKFREPSSHEATFGKRFIEGISLQLTNPKAIFFFLSVFPQFIDPSIHYAAQFSALVLTYSSLVVVIHCTYAFFAGHAKIWLTSVKGSRIISITTGATFVLFGAALATAKR
jgi:homoserine/homoserine lactone efflux protein